MFIATVYEVGNDAHDPVVRSPCPVASRSMDLRLTVAPRIMSVSVRRVSTAKLTRVYETMYANSA